MENAAKRAQNGAVYIFRLEHVCSRYDRFLQARMYPKEPLNGSIGHSQPFRSSYVRFQELPPSRETELVFTRLRGAAIIKHKKPSTRHSRSEAARKQSPLLRHAVEVGMAADSVYGLWAGGD